MLFRSNDERCCLEHNHNKPLFVSVEHRNKLIRKALVDQGSCINILPTSILQELGYGREHLMPDSLSVTSVSPTKTDTVGCLSLHISVGSFSMPHIFHVMDIDPIWHMLLGRPWIHDHRCVPSSWHQCIKAVSNKTVQIQNMGLTNPFSI